MDEEWKSLIIETTDEIRRLPTEKAVEENKFEKNSAQAKTILDAIIIPALNELKVELDTHHTPASVTSSEKSVSGEAHYRASITVKLSGLLRDVNKNKAHSADYPEFFYEICIGVSPYQLSYHNKCRVTDTTGSRELRETGKLPTTFDLTSSSIPDLTSDNIKWDFGLRYNDSVGFLRTTQVRE